MLHLVLLASSWSPHSPTTAVPRPYMYAQGVTHSHPALASPRVPLPREILMAIQPRAMSGDALEDYWERLRGKPFRRSLRLWWFSLVATWKIVRARKNEAAEKRVASWVRDQLLLLGPTMIKLGQVASARTDLLPPSYTDELSSLQADVPTISPSRVDRVVRQELGTDISSVYDRFDMDPIAGASLGQVHLARFNGNEVAVKVQRLNLRELFDTDFFNIRLMARIGNFIEARKKRKSGVASRDWLQYTNDAARLLYLEIDYLNEANNARAFASSLPASARVVVPRVFDRVTTKRLLTMEYIPSVKLTNKEKLRSLGLNEPALAKQVVDIFLTQLLRSGVLHCDPHPGNMCVNEKGELVFYDFGMVDVLEPQVQEGMRNAAFALFGGSASPSVSELRIAAAQLLEGVQQMGFVNKAADPMALQKVSMFVVKNFKDEAAGRETQDVTKTVGPELQSLVDDGVIQFPSIFTFIARAFASVDGLSRGLDPEYNFRKLCEPYVSEIISERYQKEAALKRQSLLAGVASVVQAPGRIKYLEETVRSLEGGELTVRSRSVELERSVRGLEKRISSLRSLLLAATFLQISTLNSFSPLSRWAVVLAAFFGLRSLRFGRI
ncbi:hypothetical protein AB1Y20_009974 [Prymnesium parvum]|uniref:Protein kinase domain-containing protein n=1 Tax=Prymnesium parvum TaxID=97485 RepID=A0AB34K338_PRYPA